MGSPLLLRVAVLFGIFMVTIYVTANDADSDIAIDVEEMNNGENPFHEDENEPQDTEPSEVILLEDKVSDNVYITEENPDALLDKMDEKLADGIWLIEYFSNNCSTCQELDPIWEKLAKLVKKKKNPKSTCGEGRY